MSDAQSINVDDFRTAANEMRKAYGHHNAVCTSTDLLLRALAEIESDAKVIAEKDAEIGRLNSAFDDCAENANASQAEVGRLEKVIAALREALSGIVEYCSGDGRPLGAIDRLVAVCNTAERALAAANEQTAGEVMAEGHELVLAFRDQSPSFAHGFTCGRIWQQMRERSAPFSETILAELREDVIAMATAAGWVEEFIELSPEWLRVTFMRDGHG